MTATAAKDAKFTEGSILRHVLVMTGTASIGLIAIFMVDFANLFYISLLGERELAAAIGYASTLLFFAVSINIGVMVAATALVSRAVGSGERKRAREMAGTALIFVIIVTLLLCAVSFPFLKILVESIGAKGETATIAVEFLQVVMITIPLMGVGLCMAGFLRSVGDAKRAMYVTLIGGFISAVIDPVLIFTFDFGVQGAAYSAVISRISMVLIGAYFILVTHKLIAIPSFASFLDNLGELKTIIIPAVLTNVATPVGNAYVTGALAEYGDDAVAGWAIIGRLIPVAFGFMYALSGAIGPIIGQNYGANRCDRVRETVQKSLTVAIVYTGVVWLIVYLLRDVIIDMFNAQGNAADLVIFFINLVIVTFAFNAMQFVGNAAFNNLGFASYSTYLNWGKATLGTVPFVWLGGSLGDANGVLLGWGLGAVLFGLVAVFLCLRIVKEVERQNKLAKEKELACPIAQPNLSPFSSEKCAAFD